MQLLQPARKTGSISDDACARELLDTVPMVTRVIREQMRRHLQLSVTPAGEAALREARQMAQAHLQEKLSGLTAKQRTAVADVMQLLRGVFGREASGDSAEQVIELGHR